MVPRIGFIGLGIMGMPMARNLMKAGFPLTVHNRSQAKVEDLVKEGARRAASPREVASATDIVITMLPNSPDVELVALGASGIRQGVRAGQLFIDMSTINPIISQKIGKELAPLGVAMVDAPVSGGEKGAIDGALSIMAGGAPEDFERALPVFNALGKTITHMGPIGTGGFTDDGSTRWPSPMRSVSRSSTVIGRSAGSVSSSGPSGRRRTRRLASSGSQRFASAGGRAHCAEPTRPSRTTRDGGAST